MSKKIIGVTVGTPMSPKRVIEQTETDKKIEQLSNDVAELKENAPIYHVSNYGISTDSEDNTSALQALVDLVYENGGGTIYFPIGTYSFKKSKIPGVQYGNSFIEFASIWMKSGVSIVGENERQTVLKLTEPTPYAMFGYQGTPDTPIVGCSYSNFTVSAYDTEWNSETGNKVYSKAFAYQYVRDCVFDHLILKGTLATGLGIDFLDRVDIGYVNTIDCGRAYDAEKSGRSGIGIGTGGWETENFIIHDCITKGSGQYGIFIENQFNLGWGGTTDYSKGCIIRDCIIHSGLNKGVGILSGQYVSVIGCQVYENASDGIYIEGKCDNVKVTDNNFAYNGGSGVVVANKVEKHGCVSTVEKLVISDNMIESNSGNGVELRPSAPVTNAVIKSNEILDNGGCGIAVSGDIDSLVIRDNYDKGNVSSLNLGKHTYNDFVCENNLFFGEIVNNGTFTGDTAFNDLLVEMEEITIPLSEFTAGVKLMPDGSVGEQSNGFTCDYIDISGITGDTFTLKFSSEFSASYRVGQYDADKNSLYSDENPCPMTKAYDDSGKFVYEATFAKLTDAAYIRIFLANIKDGDFTVTINVPSKGGNIDEIVEEVLKALPTWQGGAY